MPTELYIPQPQDNITPAMNLYKLMQQKKEYELDLQKQGSLQDYHKQLGQQSKMQNIISLAKDQPEAATQLFNNDPELVQANKGQQVKFLPEQSDADWNVFETGDTLSKINKKTGEVKNTGLPIKNPKDPAFEQLLDAAGITDPKERADYFKAKLSKETTHQPAAEQKVILAQETEERKAIGKGFGEKYTDAQKSADLGQDRIDKLERAESLLEGVSTGKLTPVGTEIAAYLQSIGINIDKNLDNKQAVNSMMKEFALQLRNPQSGGGLPGQMSDQDRAYLTSIPPGIEKTPGGNLLIMQTLKKLAARQIEYADKMDEYRIKNGTLDGFGSEWRRYVQKNRLFPDKLSLPSPQEAEEELRRRGKVK